ncbi:thioredoxin family protein [Candidatus Nanohalovita haloferacivicina]|uniref:thioredoxin family protein n=1 Tax=Candidatus Nanohalovita haloferacivicina TaxID=2978046 RepID=UPI00325F9FD4|nr:Thioredoxin [Candidatus Nanohalobia archaeon BNXNv]
MRRVTVEVFYSQTCPNCPPQKELAKKFEDEENVRVRMTDVARKNGRAKNHGVRAVPTTVVDGPGIQQKKGFKGVMAEEKLETAIEVARGEKEPEALENPGILSAIRDRIT